MSQKEPDSSVQRQIDENLKRVYGDVSEQSLPNRFVDLLKQLKDAESSEGKSG